MSANPAATWVFGYGSLVWRPAFPHSRAVPATLPGWLRRFWQGSIDHRGVPGAPGRVATLVRSADSEVWGQAYRIEPADWPEVQRRLDHREQYGYERHLATLTLINNTEVEAWVYHATPDNRGWLGPAPLMHIARTINGSHGPSGSNREYLLQLAAALEDIGADDPHTEALAALVMQMPPSPAGA